MKKLMLLFIVPLVVISVSQAQISQEHADQIIIEHLGNDSVGFTIYAKDTVQADGFSVITNLGEIVEVDYSCWVYYLHYTKDTKSKYIILKESNGNVLEINIKNGKDPEDLEEWRTVPAVNHSVWKYTEMFPAYIICEMSFYPSIGKLKINIPTPTLHELHGTYDYYICASTHNGVEFVIHTSHPMPIFQELYVLSKGKKEMVLQMGWGPWPITLYLECLTTFDEI